MRIGLLGGTFDPIHIGHMVLAQECWYHFSLDKVIFVPANIPPHKKIKGDVTIAQRVEMTRLALSGDRRFEIATYEIEKRGTSYSIETIEFFREQYGRDAELFFLTGADSVEDLSTWKGIDRILELVTFVAATRPGWKITGPWSEKIVPVVIPLVEVSSSMVRGRMRKGEPVDYMLLPSVLRYIQENGLYGVKGDRHFCP